MSLFGSMNTAISGMNGQTNKLSTVSDNIANADTIGYKKAQIKFSSFLLPSSPGQYNSGGVQSHIAYDIETQGALKSTNSTTDIAISGRGFFVVQDTNGVEYLTRAGSFQVDEGGYLKNAAGFTLMGTPVTKNGTTALINGLAGLVPVNLEGFVPKAGATDTVTLGANLDSRSSVIAAGSLPSTNSANAAFTKKVSVTAYDGQGAPVVYDVYYAKSADASAGPPAVGAKWEVSIYRQDTATNGGFPYTAGIVSGNNVVNGNAGNSFTMTFDPVTNRIAAGSLSSLKITDQKAIPAQDITFDFSAFTQLATEYSPAKQEINGQKAAKLTNAKIDTDGTVYAIYSDNSTEAVFRLPLADVSAPDGLEPLPGNIYRQTTESGVVFTGFPGEGAFGKTIAGSLEASNVDMAEELTDMIQAQRNYTANSKVFQTGADLMDILVNLKR